jgi:hypothetical protein
LGSLRQAQKSGRRLLHFAHHSRPFKCIEIAGSGALALGNLDFRFADIPIKDGLLVAGVETSEIDFSCLNCPIFTWNSFGSRRSPILGRPFCDLAALIVCFPLKLTQPPIELPNPSQNLWF